MNGLFGAEQTFVWRTRSFTSVNAAASEVLVISDDPAVGAGTREALSHPGGCRLTVSCVGSLAAGVTRLVDGGVDVILLDPFLPDSQGIDSFDALFLAAPRIPILVVTDRDHEETGRRAVRHGAKDRVLKEHIGQVSFGPVVRHAMTQAAADAALFVERERARITLDAIGDAVISTDRAGCVTYINPAGERMIGRSLEDVSGRRLADVFHLIDGDTRMAAPNPMEPASRRDGIAGLPGHAVLIRPDGSELAIEDSIAPIHDESGQAAGAVMVFRDVTHSRALETRLAHLAHHDVLTDLPNRQLTTDRLNHSIASARRYGRHVAVLFVDLDRFKHVNDTLGHEVGDTVLREVAKRLVAAVRGSDTVSRHGGDEFVVVLSEVEHARNAGQHAGRLHAALTRPYAIAGHDLRVNASIGVAVFPEDAEDAATLIKRADAAMYCVKNRGRGAFGFFRPEMSVQSAERQPWDSQNGSGRHVIL